MAIQSYEHDESKNNDMRIKKYKCLTLYLRSAEGGGLVRSEISNAYIACLV